MWSDLQKSQLLLYLSTLKEWNQKFNLVSRNLNLELHESFFDDSQSILANAKQIAYYANNPIYCTQNIAYHLLNSLQLHNFLPVGTIGDVGSGNGLPGILLAILGHDITLIESNAKKANFLQHVCSILEIESNGHNTQEVNLDQQIAPSSDHPIKLDHSLKNASFKCKVLHKPIQECGNIAFDCLVSRAFSGRSSLLEAIKNIPHKTLITLRAQDITLQNLQNSMQQGAKCKASKHYTQIAIHPGFGSNVVVYTA